MISNICLNTIKLFYSRLFIVVIICLINYPIRSKGQYSSNSNSTETARLAVDSTLSIPTGCGIPVGLLTLNGGDSSKSALYYDSCGHKFWSFDPALKSWNQVVTGIGLQETDPTVGSHIKAITVADINNWNNKQTSLGFNPLNPSMYPVNSGGETLNSVVNRASITSNTITTGGNIIKAATPSLTFITNADTSTSSIIRNVNGNSLAFTNNVKQVGNVGKSLLFNTGTNYVDLGHNFNAPVYSISLWFNLISSPTSGSGCILAYTYQHYNAWSFGIKANTNRVVFNETTFYGGLVGNSVALNTWHHFLMTWDGTNTKVYEDGVNIYLGNATAPPLSSDMVEFVAGYSSHWAYQSELSANVKLDQLLIYSSVLSPTDVLSIYNNGIGTALLPQTNNLLRRYEFEEGIGNITSDITTNNINASLYNNVNWSSGIAPISGVSSVATFLQSTDGLTNGEKGRTILGDFNGGTILQGKNIRTFIGSHYPFVVGNTGSVYINPLNVNPDPNDSSNYSLDVYGKSRFSDTISGSHLKLIALGAANSTDSIVTVDSNGNLNKKDLGQLVTSSNLNGTAGYLSKFTSNNTLGNSSLYDNGIGVGVGTTNPGIYKLAVEGTIGARKVKVTQASWADYVFNDGYRLRPLTEVESFIKENKHLPEIPSAKEVEKNGVDVGDNQALLLKKIEELTLYMIEIKKENNDMRKKIEQLDAIIKQSK
jgi:hypothetical protein